MILHIDVNLSTLCLGDKLFRDPAGHDAHQEFAILRVVVQAELTVVDTVAQIGKYFKLCEISLTLLYLQSSQYRLMGLKLGAVLVFS